MTFSKKYRTAWFPAGDPKGWIEEAEKSPLTERKLACRSALAALTGWGFDSDAMQNDEIRKIVTRTVEHVSLGYRGPSAFSTRRSVGSWWTGWPLGCWG